MKASNDMLTMFAQELVVHVLVKKSREGSPNYTLSELFTDGEYAAMVRATGYAIGAGAVFDTDEWRTVCQQIRDLVNGHCSGWNAENAGLNEITDIAENVWQSLRAMKFTRENGN